jgi:uridine kinase
MHILTQSQTKKHADIVIPRGPDNNVAIDIIIQYIQDLLQSSESKGTNI